MELSTSQPRKHARRPSLLSEELVRALVAAGQVDVLVGVPTLDNATTIGRVVQTVMAAFAGPLARQRTLLLDADGGSTDGTPDVVRGLSPDKELVLARHPLRTVHRISTPYHGVPGRSSALRLVLAAADLLGAKVVVIVDPDAVALSSAGIAALARAVLDDGFDVAKPLTRRSPWERPLVTQLVAPLLRAAYGKRLVEPMATQFACAGTFGARLLKETSAWDSPDANHTIDAWLTARAMAASARIGQVWAPGAVEPAHKKRPPPRDVFRQVVGGLFAVLRDDLESWIDLRGSEDVVTLGEVEAAGAVRPAFDVSSFASAFARAARDLGPVLGPALGEELLAEIAAAAAPPPPRLDEALWARTATRAFASAARRTLPVSQIVAALFPLYLGRVATFFEETRDMTSDEATAKNEALGRAFEEAKTELSDHLRKATR